MTAERAGCDAKPWLAPGLDRAERHRVRYSVDERFHEAVRVRSRIARLVNPAGAVATRTGSLAYWQAAVATADGSITVEFLRGLFAAPKCFYCPSALTFANREIDHVVPLSRGGRHVAGNLVACCRPCNRSKGRSTVGQWCDRRDATFTLELVRRVAPAVRA